MMASKGNSGSAWILFFLCLVALTVLLQGATLPKDDWNPCDPEDDLCNEIYSVKKDALGFMDKIFENYPDLLEDAEETAEVIEAAAQQLTPSTEEQNETVTTAEQGKNGITTEELEIAEETTVNEDEHPCAPEDDLCNQIVSVKKDALGLLDRIFENFPELREDSNEDTAGIIESPVQKLTPSVADKTEIVSTENPSELSQKPTDIIQLSTIATEYKGIPEIPSEIPSNIENDVTEPSVPLDLTTTTEFIDLDTKWIIEYDEQTTVVYDDVISEEESTRPTIKVEVPERVKTVTSPGEIKEAEGSDIMTTKIIEEAEITEYNIEEQEEGTTAPVDILTPTTLLATTERDATSTAPTTLGTTRAPPTTIPPPPRDCDEIWERGNRDSGIYHIHPDNSYGFRVFCDLQDSLGGWTVIQRRVNGSVNFYQSYFDYLMGFGDLEREFYLGNEKIYQLTNQKDYELSVLLFDFEGESRYARYRLFRIGDYQSDYELTVRGYIGNAGNSLGHHSQGRFSTFDRDNDENPAENCARTFASGWWFKNCDVKSNLNGQYLRGEHSEEAKGITWAKWKGLGYSLKYVTMKIRPLKL